MLQIEMKRLGVEENFEVVYVCPKCGQGGSFCFYAPEYCNKCLEKLPNIAALFGDLRDKLLYHKYGYTISDRTFNETIRTTIERGL